MRILAIDPGNAKSAFAVVDRTEGVIRVVGHRIVPNEEMLEIIKNPVGLCGAEFAPIRHCVIEMIQSFGMAVGAEVFETVFWIGRFYEAWPKTLGMNAHRVFRKDVKMHLCHSMRAKDPNIRQALIDKLGPAGTKKEPGPTYGVSKDVWSALAVGVTWIETKGA